MTFPQHTGERVVPELGRHVSKSLLSHKLTSTLCPLGLGLFLQDGKFVFCLEIHEKRSTACSVFICAMSFH